MRFFNYNMYRHYYYYYHHHHHYYYCRIDGFCRRERSDWRHWTKDGFSQYIVNNNNNKAHNTVSMCRTCRLVDTAKNSRLQNVTDQLSNVHAKVVLAQHVTGSTLLLIDNRQQLSKIQNTSYHSLCPQSWLCL